MRQVITALIDNAMRHAHNCTRMIGRVLRIGDYAVFTLSDNGQNQSPPNDTLFERFRRGTIQSEGSGLGLSVVRALVEAHHGKVNIQATPENGFEVIVQLPLIAGAAS
jgi:signal transduction histidine kinase